MFKLVKGDESYLYYGGNIIATVNDVGFSIYATNSALEVRSYRVNRIIMDCGDKRCGKVITNVYGDSMVICEKSDAHYYYCFSRELVTSTNYPCDLDIPDIMDLSEKDFESVLAVSEMLDMKHDEAMAKIYEYKYFDNNEFKECGKYVCVTIEGNIVSFGECYKFMTKGPLPDGRKIVPSLVKQYMQTLVN